MFPHLPNDPDSEGFYAKLGVFVLVFTTGVLVMAVLRLLFESS